MTFRRFISSGPNEDEGLARSFVLWGVVHLPLLEFAKVKPSNLASWTYVAASSSSALAKPNLSLHYSRGEVTQING